MPDSLICLDITLLKKEIDSVTYIRQDFGFDSTRLTTYKKDRNKLFFKNELNPQYQLFFDFENLKGGHIKRFNQKEMYKIVYKDKIKYKEKYLYRLKFEPVEFKSTENSSYYYDEDGECVIILEGFLSKYYLREDYFDKKLRYNEKGEIYFD